MGRTQKCDPESRKQPSSKSSNSPGSEAHVHEDVCDLFPAPQYFIAVEYSVFVHCWGSITAPCTFGQAILLGLHIGTMLIGLHAGLDTTTAHIWSGFLLIRLHVLVADVPKAAIEGNPKP